jgi:SPP1 family predicted phage head-tail adaptor
VADQYSADDLNRRVSIYRLVLTSDGGGGSSKVPQLVASVWAGVKSSPRNEAFMGNEIQNIQPYEVILNWRSDITTANYLQYGAKKLNIGSIEDVNEERRWLVLKCQETR